MKIIKSNQGVSQLFDSEDITISRPYLEKTRELQPLHLSLNMTDFEFLQQWFPKNHMIFLDFSNSYYYLSNK